MLKIAGCRFDEALHAEISQGDDLSRHDDVIGCLIHNDRQDGVRPAASDADDVELAFVCAAR
ncbi:hypothetical protein D3C72_2584890 [compost metagenome]